MRNLFSFLSFLTISITSAQENGLAQKINNGFKPLSDSWSGFVFYPITIAGVEIPLVVIMLLLASLIFTLLFKFINIRRFPISINIVRGKYDKIEYSEKLKNIQGLAGDTTLGGDAIETIRIENNEGEVSHFQALTAALSGTVGLGNIAGVAVALSLGGPGATFWMIIAGLLGMSAKFVECTLAVKYRDIDGTGKIYGGPMYYLKKGLADVGQSSLGKILAIFFAIMVIGGAFGTNMFQSNQAAQQFTTVLGFGYAATLPFGIVISILVGIVVLGGISRIGTITEKIVPFMVGIYVITAIVILASNFNHIGDAFTQIINGAFNPKGIAGGFLGVIVQGFKRAAFSNEAGVGSAAIAHSAVKTKYAASEGLVALLEPFIDTVVVCTMTALVIIITNSDGTIMTYGVESPDGVLATSKAFASVFPWFPYILTVAVILFAFSTMLSWSYYGLQGWTYLFGRSSISENIYKLLFCLFVIVGAVSSLGSVTNFTDAMIFAMAVPNVIGLFLLFPKVKEELSTYLKAIKVK